MEKKKRVLSINSSCYGSTGSIMTGILSAAANQYYVAVAFPFLKDHNDVKDAKIHTYKICSYFHRRICFHFAKLFGKDGIFNYFHTKKLCKFIQKNEFDLIHLHNIHTAFLDYNYFFKFIKRRNIKIIWTLHDCWAFTGHCPHFVMDNCNKWQIECFQCPAYRKYPQTLFDNSKIMYSLKKRCFTGIDNLIIVTPSIWLSKLVKKSFLKEYPVRVINNGIDLSTFCHRKSDFRKKYGISDDSYMILGVAFSWGIKKGVDVFVKLSKLLPNNYKIVLVGKKENLGIEIPNNIISIQRTHNQIELAEIYSAADLFVNPTREEVLGLVNVEALGCGTPVITFNTGGSPECIDDTCGVVVDCDDIDLLEKEIVKICTTKPFSPSACINRAKLFNKNERFMEYVKLYDEL